MCLNTIWPIVGYDLVDASPRDERGTRRYPRKEHMSIAAITESATSIRLMGLMAAADGARGHDMAPYLRWSGLAKSLALVCLLSLMTVPTAPLLAAGTSGGDAGSIDRAAVAIERQFDDMRVGEAAFALMKGDEQLVAGYGAASPDTPFVIASVSKSFTALAILQLVDRGLVGLDSPVTAYIDWFKTADQTTSITVRQLLNQTSGLSTLDGTRDAFSPGVTLEERVRSIGDYRLIGDPGAEFNYSNLNYAVLGLIIEEVTGRGYGEFVDEEIFEPLGMDHSHFDFSSSLADGLATGTITVFGFPVSLTQTAFPGLVPDGYLISTATDMARYARFQMGDGRFSGRRLLSAESMAIMHTPAVASPGGQYLDEYAMGWRTGSIDGEPLIAHDGNTFGFHADVAVLPEIDAAVVVLVARSGLMVNRMDRTALEALVGETTAAGPSHTIVRVVLVVVAVGLVLAVIGSVALRRRRRRMNPPRLPRRWPALLQLTVGLVVGAAVVFVAGSLTGGLDLVTIRLFWRLAPDVLIVAVAIPLLLLTGAATTLRERRVARTVSARPTEPRGGVEQI
jgi:CubicO group peptidase (beta-lactamase class C family)